MNFNPRSPCGERLCSRAVRRRTIHFNPRSPCGERPDTRNALLGPDRFQSTLPLRGATIRQHGRGKPRRFQSTLPLRGATGDLGHSAAVHVISIHAPLAGSDLTSLKAYAGVCYFNPRSPCGERLDFGLPPDADPEFQSTLPLRGATKSSMTLCTAIDYFNPRSPCGERRADWRVGYGIPVFQSTLPLRGATSMLPLWGGIVVFQSTLPLRGATAIDIHRVAFIEISIHAPLAGSDPRRRGPRTGPAHFNPRSPCGERPMPSSVSTISSKFQSTLPLRGATA